MNKISFFSAFGDHGSVVKHLPDMKKAQGSIPDISSF